MSLIFNIFVLYTLFNQINCRIIDDSFNIFVRINRSLLFILICLCEIGLQVAIIYVGKSPFHIINEGLTGGQWGICIGFSAITFVVSFLVKLIPIHVFIDKWIESKGEEEEDEDNKENKEIVKTDNDKEDKENKLSNGGKDGKDKILDKEDWDSERNLKDIVYKKES